MKEPEIKELAALALCQQTASSYFDPSGGVILPVGPADCIEITLALRISLVNDFVTG